MNATAPDLSQSLKNNPESRLNKLIGALHLERMMASAPATLRHKIAVRRNPYFRRVLLLESTNDGSYELETMRQMSCIFIHVPKTAGISVARALFGSCAGGHIPLFMYLWLYGSNRFDTMFKFAFVRHPESRIVSAYNFLSKGGILEADQRWSKQWLSGCASIEEFIQERLPSQKVREALHFRPQSSFLTDPRTRKIGADFLGKVESLDHDIEYVNKALGISKRIPKLNTSGAEKDAAPLSAASRRVVEEIYAEDYKNFGY